MSLRFLKWSIIVLVVGAAGCATGPKFAQISDHLQPVQDTKTRLVFFRTSHFVGSAISAHIKINGEKVGTLGNGAVLIVDRQPGDLAITIEQPISFSGLQFVLKTNAGSELYIEVASGDADDFFEKAGALPYLLGGLRAQDVNQHCGADWCAAIRNRDEALPKLSELELEAAPK